MVVLKDLLDFSRDGEWGKAEPFPDAVQMIVVRGTDFDAVRIGEVKDLPQRHIAAGAADRKRLKPWDILFETAGGSKNRPTGRSVLLKPNFFSRNKLEVTCASFARFLRVDPRKAFPPYIFWLLQHLYFDGTLFKYHTQHTGVARFQYTTFAENESLDLPPLPTQRRIAAILLTYDDLIENNTRRIAILEEMARRLYEEWFVHFRFPGHEDVEMVESELGPIPEGWEVKPLKEVVALNYGKALKASDRIEGSCPVYGSSGVVGTHENYLVEGPGIIVGRKGNVGSVHWSQFPFYPIDTVYYVQTELSLEYVFHNLQNQNFLNNDAAVPGLNREQAYSLPFVHAPSDLIFLFSEHARRFKSLSLALERKNTNLCAQRDLLLPKLISGEIDVSAAEEELEEAAA